LLDNPDNVLSRTGNADTVRTRKGTTVGELDLALRKCRETVTRCRSGIQSHTSSLRERRQRTDISPSHQIRGPRGSPKRSGHSRRPTADHATTRHPPVRTLAAPTSSDPHEAGVALISRGPNPRHDWRRPESISPSKDYVRSFSHMKRVITQQLHQPLSNFVRFIRQIPVMRAFFVLDYAKR